MGSIVHPSLGVPAAVYKYASGVVCRWDNPQGKEIRPAVPDGRGGWQWRALPDPRPLYGLDDLTARPAAQVLIVEGEKCADAAMLVVPGLVSVTWSGGGRAVHKTDWKPLAGRRVVIWPDNDEPGAETAVAVAEQCWQAGAVGVKIIRRPGAEQAEGWDIADAVSEGWDAPRIIAWLKPRAVEFTAEMVKSWRQKRVSVPQIGRTDNVVAIRPEITIPSEAWRNNLVLNEDGVAKPRLNQNFKWMLRCHPDTAGLFAWNEIAEAVFLTRNPAWSEDTTSPMPRRLRDTDIFETTTFLERRGLGPRKTETADTIYDVASFNRYNPVRDYLTGLKWDGVPRLQGGMWEGDTIEPLSVEYLGAPSDPIYATFMVKWHIAAVARIMRPGCQVDNMIVLESPQGRRKSSYVRTMATVAGIEYFCDDVGDITNKDSIIRLHGCWLVEIAELASLRRSDTETSKAWITRRSDRYRPPYEREVKDVPRHFVLAASVNPSGYGYLKDPTGNRRFWPVPIRDIHVERVARDRDQIWAESMRLYETRTQWWATRDDEQRIDELTGDRRTEDPWQDRIHVLLAQPEQKHALANGGMGIDTIISALGIPVHQQSEFTAKRVAETLKEAGLTPGRNGTRRVWRRITVDDPPQDC